jgi:hypothetical protein
MKTILWVLLCVVLAHCNDSNPFSNDVTPPIACAEPALIATERVSITGAQPNQRYRIQLAGIIPVIAGPSVEVQIFELDDQCNPGANPVFDQTLNTTQTSVDAGEPAPCDYTYMQPSLTVNF